MDRTDALSRLQASGKFALELEAVSKHFGALVALADINLAVRAGERRAILGSNGAGKTTLLKLIADLLKPESKDALTAILTYHVVPGKVMSTDLSDGMSATTVQGGDLTVDLSDGVKINEASVTSADVEASNGVIHVVDTVILPEESS